MNPAASSELVHDSGVDAQNPWPGLVAFTEELQQFFYGRSAEVDELRRRVERKNLTVLFGQAGLGKSSLLHAGLFPHLRTQGYLPIPIRLDHATSAPALSLQVKEAVTRAILDSDGQSECGAAHAGDSLWEHFHRRSLCQKLPNGEPVRLILVFDQFEELFAFGQANEETRARAAQFLRELADFIENRAPQTFERRVEENPDLVREFIFAKLDYRMLICLREDYLPHLESLRQSMPSIAENRMRLTRMSGTSALEAVTGPGGDLITPEVGRQVVRFVAGGRSRQKDLTNTALDDDGLLDLEVEPSLLSLMCRELNGRRLTLGLPQVTADLLAGNRERILQDFYERCVSDQAAEVRAFVEDELVTDSGLRENMALERARKSLTQRGVPFSAIDVLVERRLLRLEERLGVQRVELTHDVLTPVVKKSRDERQQREAAIWAEETQEILEDDSLADVDLRDARARASAGEPPTRGDAAFFDQLTRPLLHLEQHLDVLRMEPAQGAQSSMVHESRDEPVQQEAACPAEKRTRATGDKARRQRKRSPWIMSGMTVALILVVGYGAVKYCLEDTLYELLLSAVVVAFGAVSYYQYHVGQKRLLEMEKQREHADTVVQEAMLERAAVEKLVAELKKVIEFGPEGIQPGNTDEKSTNAFSHKIQVEAGKSHD